jgi:hypothetical protein
MYEDDEAEQVSLAKIASGEKEQLKKSLPCNWLALLSAHGDAIY